MLRFFQYSSLPVGVIVCWLAFPGSGLASQGRGGISAEEQQRRLVESRNEFLRSLDRIPAGGGDRRREADFRDDVRSFGEQLVGVWTLRFAPVEEEWVREDLEDRSEDLRETLERMRKHVDRGSDPPEFEAAAFEGLTLDQRLDQLVFVGFRLRSRVLEVTGGEVLDLGLLNDVRADFATLEAWADQLRELARE